MRYQLVSNNPSIGSVLLRGKPLRIGRHPDNEIVIRDDLASRFHCVIETDEKGRLFVKDLGSRNGTKLNQQLVDASPVKPGDVITVGGHSFQLAPVAKKGAANGGPRGATNAKGEMKWVAQLVRLIEMLPPKDTGARDPVQLIDASGNESAALASESVGPVAVRLLLIATSKSRATDIHFEPKKDAMHIRLRVDGVMVDLIDLPEKVGEVALGFIRTACEIKQGAPHAVLEGHFSVRFTDRRVDYRASFTPSVHGRKLVLRVLDTRDTPKSLNDLGMAHYMLERVRTMCGQDSGMLLVVGPTGSGKTTTLYNCMRAIAVTRRNVITIEDPVEYHLEGITQIPVGDDRGNTFNTLLRSVLRQDPDVILLGEVRDEETARTAMQAAMTGHLVFSTLHARDTVGSVFRLLDLGVEPYLVANSLSLVLAQRLVRVLCPHCKRKTPVTPGQVTRMGRFGEGLTHVSAATGCAKCLRTGYRGRRAIFELMDVGNDLRDVILSQPTIHEMRKVIDAGLFTTLKQSAYQLVTRGVTSLEEVEHVVGD